jgi:hypothetical protein
MSGQAFSGVDTGSPEFPRMPELGATVCLRKPFTPSALVADECLEKAIASVRPSK